MVKTHTSQKPTRPQFIPVSVTWSNLLLLPGRDLVHRRVPPSSMSSVPVYTPGWRETKCSKVLCLRKQRGGRGLNPGPPDPEFVVLTARPHTPPMLCFISLQGRSLRFSGYQIAHTLAGMRDCRFHKPERKLATERRITIRHLHRPYVACA